jgi:membrane protein implicated in regulation of membrane protease activity
MNRKHAAFAGLVAAGLVFAAGPAAAYIGPGAGLSLLGALWGVAAAVVAALLFLLLWPLRRLLRKRHPVQQHGQADQAAEHARAPAQARR